MISTFALACCGAAFGLGIFATYSIFKTTKFSNSKIRFSFAEIKVKFLKSLNYLGGPVVAILVFLITNWLIVSVVLGLVVIAVPALK